MRTQICLKPIINIKLIMENKKKKILKNFQAPEEVLKAIEFFDLIKKGDKILISFSGGPDSIFLTLVLLKLKDFFDLKISLFYLFHKLEGSLRPEEAEKFAKEFNLNIFIFEENIPDFAKKEKLNIEEAGRKRRYKLLFEISEKENFNKIATAHTLNDAFETFFLRFLREGFSLLNPPLRPKFKNVIRPLILLEREKIIKILKENEIPYHIDIENYSLKRTRNKIRHILIPFLVSEFSYDFRKFRKFYIRTIEENEYFEREIGKEIGKLIEDKRSDYIKINKEKILKMDSFKRREILKHILFYFGFEDEITRENLYEIEKILFEEGKMELKGAFSFISRKENVLFLKEIENFEIDLKEGEYEIKNFAKIKIKVRKGKGFLPAFILNKAKIRLRKRGDIIEVREGKILKLKKFFENKKVPFYLRDRLIMVEYNGKIIWIEGFEPFLKGNEIEIEVERWK